MKYYVYALLLGLTFAACDKDADDDGTTEEEVITTLIYTLAPEIGGDAVVFTFRDTDGDGGNAPTIETAPLQANTRYTGAIQVLNESVSPADDITAEVREEDEDHQFFFKFTVDGLSVEYADADSGGLPLGLETILFTGDPGTGTLTVILRHEPNKNAQGNAETAGGETDIEVEFPLVVE